MTAKWLLVLSTLVCLSCGGDDKKPTEPSGGGATRITLIAPHPTLAVGESQQLTIVVTGPDGIGRAPDGATAWTSSDQAVCTVGNSGLAVAVGPGQAMITAVAEGRTVQSLLHVESNASGLRHIQGRATDFATDAPLTGVPVVFTIDGSGPSFQATSDSSGGYAIDLPVGYLAASVGGLSAGELTVRVGSPAYRADLLGRAGEHCKSRYGLVTDAVTFQPVAGASVRLGPRQVVTGPDGWYRLDYGCVYDPYNNIGTTFIYASHPAYREFSRVVGLGIQGVKRLDLELQRP